MSMTGDPIKWRDLVGKQVNLWQARRAWKEEHPDKDVCVWDKAHVTISRAYGARGYKIGERIAELLKWQVYSKRLVEYVAETAKLREKVVSMHDERRHRSSLSQTFFESNPYTSDKYYRHLVQVILAIADQGRAVIVGRGGSFITDNTFGLHVRLTAPMEYRIQRYMAKNDVSIKEARKKVESMDETRDEYTRHYFHAAIDDPNNYDVTINVQDFDNEAVANYIISLLEIKFGEERPKHPTDETSCTKDMNE